MSSGVRYKECCCVDVNGEFGRYKCHSWPDHLGTISQGCPTLNKKIKKEICKPSQNSRHQKDDVKFHTEGPTNIRRQRTKFSCHCDLMPGICAFVLAASGV